MSDERNIRPDWTSPCPVCLRDDVPLIRERHGWRLALHFVGEAGRCAGTYAWPAEQPPRRSPRGES